MAGWYFLVLTSHSPPPDYPPCSGQTTRHRHDRTRRATYETDKGTEPAPPQPRTSNDKPRAEYSKKRVER